MVRLPKNNYGLVLVALLGLLLSCAPEPPVVQHTSSDFSPIVTGNYWTYTVQEEHYSLSGSPTTATYFLKEVIGDTLPSIYQSGKTFRLIRYKRTLTTDSWKTDSIWTVQLLPDKLIRTENNVPYLKLVYPISAGLAWNQNLYNVNEAASCLYQNVGKPYTLPTRTYPNTVQVINNNNDSTAISLNRQTEVYAYQTGLVFRENTALAYCQSTPDCIGKGQIAYGYRIKWTLIDAGKN